MDWIGALQAIDNFKSLFDALEKKVDLNKETLEKLLVALNYVIPKLDSIEKKLSDLVHDKNVDMANSMF